jgi:hypothetical protein
MTDSTDSRITANHRKSLSDDDRFVIRTPLGCESLASLVMTDSRCGPGKGEGDARVYVTLPLDILNGIWPRGVTLLTRRHRTSAQWLDALEREVDRGLLVRTGEGTDDSPFRYVEAMPGAFTLAPTYRRLDDPKSGMWRLLARLGLSDAR